MSVCNPTKSRSTLRHSLPASSAVYVCGVLSTDPRKVTHVYCITMLNSTATQLALVGAMLQGRMAFGRIANVPWDKVLIRSGSFPFSQEEAESPNHSRSRDSALAANAYTYAHRSSSFPFLVRRRLNRRIIYDPGIFETPLWLRMRTHKHTAKAQLNTRCFLGATELTARKTILPRDLRRCSGETLKRSGLTSRLLRERGIN